jgi:WD40 repeat protein
MVQDLRIPKLTVQLSQTILHFKPEGPPESFTVTVDNKTGEFTSFQIDLIAAGTPSLMKQPWYRLVPSVSSKIPPGDRTQFQVEIIDVPPIRGGFVNSINLVVLVDAIELGLQERQDLRLVVEGSPVRPLMLAVRKPTLEVRPGDAFEIEVNVSNRNLKAADVLLDLIGIQPSWLIETPFQPLSVPSDGSATVTLIGRLPEPAQVPEGEYRLTVDARRSPAPVNPVEVTLRVLPLGQVDVSSHPASHRIPQHPRRWLNPRQEQVDFTLELTNQSNRTLTATAAIKDPDATPPRRWRWPWHTNPQPEANNTPHPTPHTPHPFLTFPNRTITLTPAQTTIAPGDTAPLTVQVTQRLPWLGWKRVKVLQAIPSLDTTEIKLRTQLLEEPQPDEGPSMGHIDGRQRLELHILPVIPFWLQSTGLLLLLLLVAASSLFPQGHTKPVNSVQFNGRADEVVSAANDATIRRWVIRGDRLQPTDILERGDKAVRVVRYRPVNNDQIAAGFENGVLFIRNLLSQQVNVLGDQRDDRIFDLAYTRDSRRLFTAHGSGLILEWQAEPSLLSEKPLRGIKVDFAIRAIKVVGEQDQYLAIAGRYNQLTLFNRNTGVFYELPYPNGGQANYITSLAIADSRSTLLATADDQGRLTTWDLSHCSDNPSTCKPVDTWSGHGGHAIHGLAFSADGCYLASVGADGQSILWGLNQAGTRQAQMADGKTLQQVKQPLNAVDLIETDQQLLIVTGGDDTRVRLKRLDLPAHSESNQCPSL